MSDEKDNIVSNQNEKEDSSITEGDASLIKKASEFWKENHGSVTAFLSTLIGVVISIVNALYYLSNIIYTKYWGITVPRDKLVSGNAIISAIIISFGVAVVILLYTYLCSAIDSHIRIGLPLKQYLKRKKKPKKKAKKSEVEEKISYWFEMREKNRRNLIKRSFLVFISMTVVTLFFVLGSYGTDLSITYISIVGFISALLILLVIILTAWIPTKKKYKDYYKKTKLSEISPMETIEKEEEDRFKISHFCTKDYYRRIGNSVISFIVVMLVLFVIVNGLSLFKIPTKCFKTYSEGESEYVLIYQNGEYYYFDEAEFQTEGDDFVTLKVYINKNRIIKTDDIELITKTFNEVEKSLSTEETVPQGTQEPIEDTDIQGTQEPIEDTDIQGTQEPIEDTDIQGTQEP